MSVHGKGSTDDVEDGDDDLDGEKDYEEEFGEEDGEEELGEEDEERRQLRIKPRKLTHKCISTCVLVYLHLCISVLVY